MAPQCPFPGQEARDRGPSGEAPRPAPRPARPPLPPLPFPPSPRPPRLPPRPRRPLLGQPSLSRPVRARLSGRLRNPYGGPPPSVLCHGCPLPRAPGTGRACRRGLAAPRAGTGRSFPPAAPHSRSLLPRFPKETCWARFHSVPGVTLRCHGSGGATHRPGFPLGPVVPIRVSRHLSSLWVPRHGACWACALKEGLRNAAKTVGEGQTSQKITQGAKWIAALGNKCNYIHSICVLICKLHVVGQYRMLEARL